MTTIGRWAYGVVAIVVGASSLGELANAQPGGAPGRRVLQLDSPQFPVPPTPDPWVDSTDPPPAFASDRPAIMLTGYWPPSNEGVRRFSPDPGQNPQGWIGANWEGRGYDVYSYFPEFANPNCSNCGKGEGDLEVDYQDTSADFWPLADGIQPIAVITFSRGFNDDSWEVEMNQFNRSFWLPDYLAPVMPTPSPPDPSVPVNYLRLSTLPVQGIVDAVNAANLGVNAYICFTGNGGGFLSEFIAYHGVWYQDLHRSPTDPAWCVAGGHVHVGQMLSWSTTEQAVHVTLREVIDHVDRVRNATVCQKDLGYEGPGGGKLVICGDSLQTGGMADQRLSGALPGAPAWQLFGVRFDPRPFAGGSIVMNPVTGIKTFTVDAFGEVFEEDAWVGGGGPLTIYTQFLVNDSAVRDGWSISNAVQVEILP